MIHIMCRFQFKGGCVDTLWCHHLFQQWQLPGGRALLFWREHLSPEKHIMQEPCQTDVSHQYCDFDTLAFRVPSPPLLFSLSSIHKKAKVLLRVLACAPDTKDFEEKQRQVSPKKAQEYVTHTVTDAWEMVCLRITRKDTGEKRWFLG